MLPQAQIHLLTADLTIVHLLTTIVQPTIHLQAVAVQVILLLLTRVAQITIHPQTAVDQAILLLQVAVDQVTQHLQAAVVRVIVLRLTAAVLHIVHQVPTAVQALHTAVAEDNMIFKPTNKA